MNGWFDSICDSVYWTDRLLGLLASWPFVVLVIAVTMIFVITRKELIALLRRLKQLPGGIGLSESGEGQPVSGKAELLAQSTAPERGTKGQDSGPIQEQIESWRRKLNDDGLSTDAARVESLLRAVASLSIRVAFERIAGWMFKSQLELMRLANSRPVSTEDVRKIYERARAEWPWLYPTDNFERWIGFLKYWRLIEESNDLIQLSSYGQEYLRFLLFAKREDPVFG